MKGVREGVGGRWNKLLGCGSFFVAVFFSSSFYDDDDDDDDDDDNDEGPLGRLYLFFPCI